MKNLFSNLWLQLLSVIVIFIGTLATDWIGISLFMIYLALWMWNRYETR